MIESGKVLCLNMPAETTPALHHSREKAPVEPLTLKSISGIPGAIQKEHKSSPVHEFGIGPLVSVLEVWSRPLSVDGGNSKSPLLGELLGR